MHVHRMFNKGQNISTEQMAKRNGYNNNIMRDNRVTTVRVIENVEYELPHIWKDAIQCTCIECLTEQPF